MAIKLEKVVQTYYEALEEGKILGRKCPKCGNVEFPPVYACNECGSLETEWYEISGKAKLHSIVLPAALSSKPEYKELGKYAYGEVELEEGSRFNAVVRGINKEEKKRIRGQTPGKRSRSDFPESRRLQNRCV
ncbi:MAG: zinc ribbon domain-containing protein [Eubacterium sp.]